MIGRQLSHFRIEETLGAGGMGVVYKATDLRLQRTVALKVLAPDAATDPGRKGRFLREARAASVLNHPNIVSVYETDTSDGVDFIVMEYVEGTSLDSLIGAKPLDLGTALSYAVQIAEAVARAHRQGVVHRDLKPGNVMVTPEGRVKVLDFGLAKRVAPPPSVSSGVSGATDTGTREGLVVGTAPYMSPEQAQGHPVDARTDVFSFGVMLYEMLARCRPFGGDSVAGVIASILRDDPRPIAAYRPDVPAGVESILSRALEKDTANRYPSMGGVLADLQALVTAGPQAAPRPHPPSLSILRRPWLVAAGLLVAAGAAAVALWPARRTPAPSRFQLVSTFAGSHRSPSFSPDGRMVAYVETARGVPQVWVSRLDQGEPLQVTTGDVPGDRPRWSPKGDQIVFERRGEGIWSVPPLGGTPRQIVERGACPNFFPDGERILFDRERQLWTARLDGSEPRALEGSPPNFFSNLVLHCGAVSPDGSWIAYAQPEEGPYGDLWVIPSAGGTPRRLTFDVTDVGKPVWMPDGRSLIFPSARRGSHVLWRVPVAGGEPEPVTTGAGEDTDPDVSARGDRLVYGNARHAYALVVLDPASGAERVVLERRRPVNGLAFSPDGGRIAFFATTEQGDHIFTVGAQGDNLRQVTQGEGQRNAMPRWSADGASLYYYRERPDAALCKVSANGGGPSTVVAGWKWNVQNAPRLDPREGRVVYSLLEHGRLKATVVRDLASGAERSLAHALWSPTWSRDGQRIVGNDNSGRILTCPVDGQECQAAGEGWSARWSPDESRLYARRLGRRLDDPSLRTSLVWEMRPDGSGARQIAVLEPEKRLNTPFEVSPHGEIVWVQFRRGREELWMADLDR